MTRSLVLASLLLAIAPEVLACMNRPGWRVEDDIERAEAIFVGEVEKVEIRREWRPYTKGKPSQGGGIVFEQGVMYEPTFVITVAVDKVWKGSEEETIVVTTGWSSCGARVTVARRYLFYAFKTREGGLAVGSLSTKALSDGMRDLEVLGEPARDFLPEKIQYIKGKLATEPSYREPAEPR